MGNPRVVSVTFAEASKFHILKNTGNLVLLEFRLNRIIKTNGEDLVQEKLRICITYLFVFTSV